MTVKKNKLTIMSCCGSGLCCCCTSLKGASFFCTSIHVFIGMYLSIKWILVSYVKGINNEYFDDERMRVIFPLLLIYLAIFLILGCINFIAVERESVGVLKWSMRAFALLQISMMLTNVLLAFAFPEFDSDLELHRFHHIKYMIANVVTSSIYFYVIWKFTFSLENGIYVVHKKRRKCQSAPNTLDRPSAPWSNSPSVSSRLHHQDPSPNPGMQIDDQTLPLKTDIRSPSPIEPQPCSSKS